jgi:hypothetical protein
MLGGPLPLDRELQGYETVFSSEACQMLSD